MTFAFISDTHLGFRQYGFSERMDDFMIATAYAFDRAIAMKVDGIILGGDSFQTTNPPASAVYFLYMMVQKARAAGIIVWGIDGNHDATETGWLRVCGVLPLDVPAEHAAARDAHMGGLTVVGINGCSPAVFRQRLAQLQKDYSGKTVDAIVIHQSLAEMCGFQGVDLTCAEVLAAVKPLGVRLVLMGDIHNYAEAEIGGVRFIYAGSVELTERGEQPFKSFSVIRMTKDSLLTENQPIPIRPLFDVYIENDAQFDNLLAEVTKAAAGDPRLPLTLISFDPTIPDFTRRARTLLDGRVLYRLIPVPKDQQKTDVFAQLGQQTYERTGALLNLRDVIANAHAPGTDQFVLILSLLDQPDNVKGVVERYIRDRHLENLVKL